MKQVKDKINVLNKLKRDSALFTIEIKMIQTGVMNVHKNNSIKIPPFLYGMEYGVKSRY